MEACVMRYEEAVKVCTELCEYTDYADYYEVFPDGWAAAVCDNGYGYTTAVIADEMLERGDNWKDWYLHTIRVFEDKAQSWQFRPWSTRHDLIRELEDFTTVAGERTFSDIALVRTAALLDRFADYEWGCWKHTNIPLCLDTIDKDGLTKVLEEYDSRGW